MNQAIIIRGPDHQYSEVTRHTDSSYESDLQGTRPLPTSQSTEYARLKRRHLLGAPAANELPSIATEPTQPMPEHEIVFKHYA